MIIVVYDMQFEDTEAECIMWKKLNVVVEKKGSRVCPFLRGSWQIVRKLKNVVHIVYGTKYPIMKMVTKNKCGFSIRFNLLINTISNLVHRSSMIDTKPSIMITEKPCPWKKLTFDMLPFNHDGIHLELLPRALFKGSTIGSASCTFVCDNGKASCWM
jgi:hypothetical protein